MYSAFSNGCVRKELAARLTLGQRHFSSADALFRRNLAVAAATVPNRQPIRLFSL
jgi:hypothetical protein